MDSSTGQPPIDLFEVQHLLLLILDALAGLLHTLGASACRRLPRREGGRRCCWRPPAGQRVFLAQLPPPFPFSVDSEHGAKLLGRVRKRISAAAGAMLQLTWIPPSPSDQARQPLHWQGHQRPRQRQTRAQAAAGPGGACPPTHPSPLAPPPPQDACPPTAGWKGRGAALADILRLHIAHSSSPADTINALARDKLREVGTAGTACTARGTGRRASLQSRCPRGSPQTHTPHMHCHLALLVPGRRR